ncbi:MULTISPECIES: helix-turn-helix transcriptional regulator [Halomicrobium]|uniref:Helix-turn-helix domain-containing protein n=1 Tax=Halomicrobium mukohataei TaxID=57705 RepID=A0A847UBR6_9EURY|nr:MULTISPECIES: helix-turn-helix transcriptional regulator [Halomicrobium]MBO4247420.1 helix-turn-helix transcriptional regulator [Halomicrobium sp. IBSBa]NLV08704.1 helix-turn-helix domain-containing protein [Halomicrobium mukohataei]QGA83986.1 Transcriptional regulator, Xre family [Halomicrobium sp. LC1Hm]
MKNEIDTYRERAGLSQGELATAVGVSRQTINAVERERYDPSLALAFKLAAYFECRVEALFEPDLEPVGE